MKNISIIISIFIVIIIFSILLFSLFIKNLKFKTDKDFEVEYFLFYRVEITKLKTNISYIKKIDENLPIGLEIHEKNVLTFGIVPISSPIERIRRILDIENLDYTKAKIKIFCEGSICNFLNFSDNNFILNSREKKVIEISAENKNIEGYFEGNVYINVFKPRNRIWEFLIFLL